MEVGGGGRGNKVFLFSLRKGLNKRGKGEMKVDESVKVCRRDSKRNEVLTFDRFRHDFAS